MALKAATTVASTVLIVSVLLGVDLYLHHKHGINVWGYRGPALGKKQSGEKRIAVLGGSTAWGFGLKVGQDFPAQLQSRLRTQSGMQINVLNLAFNNEGAYSFKYTLNDYDYLDPDVVLLYSGYNDLNPPNQYVLRHRSPIFLWTGYLPLLPVLTADKISVWLNRGKKPVVFSPPSESNSGTDVKTSKSVAKQLGPLTDSQSNAIPAEETCPPEWQVYCQQIYEVASGELKRGKRVLVVTEPYISDQHVAQQRALAAMLAKRFAGQTHFRYLDLGKTIDLRDGTLCWDGMHLTEEGNRRIAEALIQPVLETLRRE